jgi:hypothetical protein
MYIKRKTVNNSWFFLAVLLVLAVLKGMDYLKILSFEKASSLYLLLYCNIPLYALLRFVLLSSTFILNNNYLRSHLYIEELVSKKKLKAGVSYAFLDRLGRYR